MSAWGWEDDTDSLGGGDWLEPGLDRAPAQRSGRRPGAGRSLRRLAVLVASLPLVILVPVVGITSCGPPAGSAERGYLEELASPAAASQGIGRQLTSLLSGERTDAAGPVLARLATEAERNLVALDDVKPPGRLLATSRYAQQSLELRALALRTIVHLLDGTKGGPSVALLAAQGRRLLASDVIWHDLVQDATTRSLADAGIAGRAGSGIALPV